MKGEQALMDRLLANKPPTLEGLFQEGYTVTCCGGHESQTWEEFLAHEDDMRGYYRELLKPVVKVADETAQP